MIYLQAFKCYGTTVPLLSRTGILSLTRQDPRSKNQLTFPHFSLFAVSAAASVVVDVADVIEAPLVVFDEQHDVAFLVTEAFFAVAVSVVHSDFAEAF
jgi:hypothetical protein